MLKFSEVLTDNYKLRYDPEFFGKDATKAYAALRHHRRLGDLVAEGYRVVYEETEIISCDEGIREGLPFFLQAADIETPFIRAENMGCVSRSDWERYTKGRIHPGELLIEVKGLAEKVALVPDDIPLNTLVTGTCYKMTTREALDAPLLLAFLTSRYGQALKNRLKSNLLVAFVSKEDLFSMPVPDFGTDLKRAIAANIRGAFSADRLALSQLSNAERALASALGLDTWQPPEPLTYVRRASEVLTAVRLDAEHFKPKFDDLIAHLIAGGDAVRLDQVLSFCERGRQPAYAEEGVTVVNSRHVRADAVIINGENRHATVEDETLLIRQGDILLNGTGVGTIGRVTTYLHDTPALPDNHVTILRLHPESGFDPVFLAVQLAGVVGQTQVAQHTRGSSGQLELYPQDIRRILVWRAPKEMQLAVRKNIEAAHAARREAQALLARAQRAVEIAIEQGEPAALSLLTDS